jgi:hypothetical protein
VDAGRIRLEGQQQPSDEFILCYSMNPDDLNSMICGFPKEQY